MSEPEPLIRFDEVWFSYPGSPDVLAGLSLDVRAGERVAVLGPNGSGKTTLALHVNGLLRPASGGVRVGGLPVADANVAMIRKMVGLVFQDPDDQLFMQTVRDDVAFGPANLGVRRGDLDAVVSAALGAVGAASLAPRTSHHLSGGEKRRVALATALAMQPEVLVLDEPGSGLDPAGQRELAELLVATGRTQMIITHDLPFALATCPRSVVVSGGRIVADGETREILRDEALLKEHRLDLPFGFSLSRE